jgi:putative transposase
VGRQSAVIRPVAGTDPQEVDLAPGPSVGELYPIIDLDALVVKVHGRPHRAQQGAHIAVGVDLDGVKHVLGIWVAARGRQVLGPSGRRAQNRGQFFQ